jgi:hypothetical protein
MGKTKMIFKFLFLLLLMFSKTNSYPQDLPTKKLLWVSQDVIETLVFQEKNQINEWGLTQLPFSFVSSRDFIWNEVNINIVLVFGCSGLPCLNIYAFTEKEGNWYLVAKTNARLLEQIELDIDSQSEKIIFMTKSGQIGELPLKSLKIQ